jgi:hypothetical protein
MAKILLAGTLSGISGRLGSTVYWYSPTAQRLRTAVLNAQPRTQPQADIKGTLSSLVKAWSLTLSPGDRNDWVAFAALHPRTDLFSATYYLTGMQMFVSVNQALHAVGVSPLTSPPTSYSAGAPSGITYAWNSGAQTLSLNASVQPGADDVPVIWASRMLSSGNKPTKLQLRKLTYFPAGTHGPWSIETEYQAKFGVFILGRAINLEVRYTDHTNGFQGIPSITQAYLSP